jgi:hypothetical protein
VVAMPHTRGIPSFALGIGRMLCASVGTIMYHVCLLIHNKRKRNKPEKIQHFLQCKDSLSLSLVSILFVLRLIYSLVLTVVDPCDLTIGIRVVSVLGEQWGIRGLVLQPVRSITGGLCCIGRGEDVVSARWWRWWCRQAW